MTMVCEGTSTQPSIADLLEWLSDLERIHCELYPLQTRHRILALEGCFFVFFFSIDKCTIQYLQSV